MSIDWALSLLWVGWASYWALAATRCRARGRSEPPLSRAVHALLLVSVFLLLFFEPLRAGPLGSRLFPSGLALHLCGLGVVVIGLALATWARVHLGPQWSGAVRVARDQRLVESGPYRFCRHPIYAGVLVALIGSALAVGELGAALAVPIALFAYLRKMRIEERWLAEHFAQSYASYGDRVGAIFPFRALRSFLGDSIARGQRRILDPTELNATIDRLRTSGQLSIESAQHLRQELPNAMARSAYVLRHLGAHLAIGVIFAFDVIPLPLGTICRVLWVGGNRVYESAFGSPERARVHSLKVLLVAAIPWLGYAAYLLPLRNRSAEVAWLYAQYLSYALNGRSLDEFLATKPRLLRSAGAWLVPTIPDRAATAKPRCP